MAQQSRSFSLSRLHNHTQTTPVWLLWTSDQPDAETSTGQRTTLTRDTHPCSGGIQTRNPRKRAAADPRLRPRGHWIGRYYKYIKHTHKKKLLKAGSFRKNVQGLLYFKSFNVYGETIPTITDSWLQSAVMHSLYTYTSTRLACTQFR